MFRKQAEMEAKKLKRKQERLKQKELKESKEASATVEEKETKEELRERWIQTAKEVKRDLDAKTKDGASKSTNQLQVPVGKG